MKEPLIILLFLAAGLLIAFVADIRVNLSFSKEYDTNNISEEGKERITEKFFCSEPL